MAVYGQDYDEIRRRNQSFFPNVNFGQAPGVSEGQARMNEIANTSTYKSRRAGGSMVTSPSGGQMFVPSGQFQKYQARGYQATPPTLDSAQRFDLTQAYNQGYGTQPSSIQQGPGGPYRVAGGVAAPYTPPNVFQRFGSAVGGGARGLGTFAANLGTQFQNAFNTANSFFNRQPARTASVPQQPRRYFDENY